MRDYLHEEEREDDDYKHRRHRRHRDDDRHIRHHSSRNHRRYENDEEYKKEKKKENERKRQYSGYEEKEKRRKYDDKYKRDYSKEYERRERERERRGERERERHSTRYKEKRKERERYGQEEKKYDKDYKEEKKNRMKEEKDRRNHENEEKKRKNGNNKETKQENDGYKQVTSEIQEAKEIKKEMIIESTDYSAASHEDMTDVDNAMEMEIKEEYVKKTIKYEINETIDTNGNKNDEIRIKRSIQEYVEKGTEDKNDSEKMLEDTKDDSIISEMNEESDKTLVQMSGSSNGKKNGKSISIQTTKTKPVLPIDLGFLKNDVLNVLSKARKAVAELKGFEATKNASCAKTVEKELENVDMFAPSTLTDSAVTEEVSDSGSLQNDVTNNIKQDQENAPVENVSTQDDIFHEEEHNTPQLNDFDMFCADALSKATKVVPKITVKNDIEFSSGGLQSNWDDDEGYYKASIGEVLGHKYQVLGNVGKGVFSTVVRCKPCSSASCSSQDYVAVKLIRNNDVMRKSALSEIKILTELSSTDPQNKKHCVRLLDHFEYRSHICLVFEPMQMDAREMIQSYGGKSGIALSAVRLFAHQLLTALHHIAQHQVVHADLKPDNILLKDKQVKICDFGSAFKLGEGDHNPTPYLVSRYYRAPEIVLGLPYDTAVDMWSLGCCLYEMFTGIVMFPGDTNNSMLCLFMELKGHLPQKLIRKHRSVYIEKFEMEPHFDETNRFLNRELDKITKKPVVHYISNVKVSRNLLLELMSAKAPSDDRRAIMDFKNLLDKMFILDPAKRITTIEAIKHPFFTFGN